MTRIRRLKLSMIVEPGDPRLPELLTRYDIGDVVDAAMGAGLLPVPHSWQQRAQTLPDVDSVMQQARANGLEWIIPGDQRWPLALDDLDHCEVIGTATGTPLGLWVRGAADLAELSASSVAIVGARSCTTYGADTARDLAAELSGSGFTVISGAAYGIDAFAHRGALATGSPTIAVLAGGADIAYPRAHSSLLERIAGDGCLVSEQLPGARPLRRRFLARNRIIAAIAGGTVIVEAAARSGSLNTLNWADQLGKATMAVPGPVTAMSSVGAHEAVRAGKAVLVAGAAHIAEELNGYGAETAEACATAETVYDHWPTDMRYVYDALEWHRSHDTAEIASLAQLTYRSTAQTLKVLVAAGFAGHAAGGWILLRRADRLESVSTNS